MAGIAGIFIKSSISIDHKSHTLAMLNELGYDSASYRLFSHENISYGIKGMANGNSCKAYSTPDDKVSCVVEGNVFIDGDSKGESDLPNLYLRYGDDLVHYITGWYNVFLYSTDQNRCLLFTSRFGMLPLFIYENEYFFVFCSKINGLFASQLFIPEWDKVSQLEQAIFNYPLSEHTFIENVFTVDPACLYKLFGNKITCKKYWQYDQLLDKTTFSKKDSIDLINVTMDKVVQKITTVSGHYGLSLTGGFDGRLVLSYVLKNNIKNIILYSFGEKYSPDISIPSLVSEKLKLLYEPFILDENYVNNHFLQNAKDTIYYSSGYRNYLRAHYLYALKSLSEKTECVLSGNCGSNLLKFSEIVPGAVLSVALIELIKSSFSLDCLAKYIEKYKHIMQLSQADIESFYQRLRVISDEGLRFGKSTSKNYLYFLLMKVERKFFGFELSSYNDYVFNFSPFIDFEFVDALASTIYWGPNYPFNSQSNRLKIQSFELYRSLVMANYPKLCDFRTDRGASFNKLNRIDGKIILLIKRMIMRTNKRHKKDPYNTNQLNSIFLAEANIGDYSLDCLDKNETANFLTSEYYRKDLFRR